MNNARFRSYFGSVCMASQLFRRGAFCWERVDPETQPYEGPLEEEAIDTQEIDTQEYVVEKLALAGEDALGTQLYLEGDLGVAILATILADVCPLCVHSFGDS